MTVEKKPRDIILEAAFSGEDVAARNPFDGVVMNLVEGLLHKHEGNIIPAQPMALINALKEAITLGMQAGVMTLGEIARHSETR